MINEKDIPKARGADIPSGEETLEKVKQQIQSTNLQEVKLMGQLDAKETSEMVFAVGKLVTSAKISKEDDGEITPGDASHFVDDIFPLITGITGSNKIPAEFMDGFDANDQAQINEAWKSGAELHEHDEEGVIKALKVVYALQDLGEHIGLIKPAPPTP